MHKQILYDYKFFTVSSAYRNISCSICNLVKSFRKSWGASAHKGKKIMGIMFETLIKVADVTFVLSLRESDRKSELKIYSNVARCQPGTI